MPLDGTRAARCPPTSADRVLVAVDCAKADRIGPDPACSMRREAHGRHRPPPRQLALRRRESHRRGRVVDGRGPARRLPRARRRAHARDRRAAVHRARHRHGPLPVHEHDAEVASTRGGARRGGRRRARGLPAGVRVGRVREAQAARARARARTGARRRPDRRVVLLRNDFTDVGAVEAYSEGIIDYLRAVEGSELAALIREPPREDGPTRRVSLRVERRRARRLRDRAALRRRRPSPGGRLLERRCRSTRSRPSSATGFVAQRARRALEPAGVALVDKPAGPSSFAIVAQIRRMTGARGRATPARSIRSRRACCSSSPGGRRSSRRGSSASTSAT